ncbi:MAG: ABC transporter permease subunit [Dongiaceae bacterium]
MTELAAALPARARRPTGRRWLMIVPVYAWLIALILVPNLFMLVASFWRSDGGTIVHDWTLANYAKVATSPTYQLLLLRTMLTALVAALLAAAIAYAMAYFITRNLRRHKLTAVLLVAIPLWVSLLVRVFAWRIILGENGILNSFLVRSGLLDAPSPVFLYTRFTVILTLTYVCIPFVFVTSYTALERIPRSLIEASYDSGASPWRTFRNVVWPLSRPGAAIGFALAFLVAVGDYVTPSMVGGLDGTMIGMVIASQFGLVGNWPLGAAISVTLMLAVTIVLLVVARLARAEGVLDSAEATLNAETAVSWGRGPWHRIRRALAWTAFLLPYALLYLPLVIIALFSFNASTVQALPFAGFTGKWYVALLGDHATFAALQRTWLVGLSAVLVSAVVGTAFALVFHYLVVPGRALLQGAITVPVALPGVVLGVALAIGFRSFGIPPGLLRLCIGHATFVMPVVMLVVLARLQRLDPSYAQASMDLGADRRRTFLHVIFPLIRSALLGGALLGFTLSVDEVIVTLFLTGVQPTLPIHIWNQMRFGFTPSINAVFTCIGLLSLVVILAATRILRADLGQRGRAGAG